VEEVQFDSQVASCRDENGITVDVPMGIRSGNSGWPQEGETWLLTKQFGRWTFNSIVGSTHPIVITAPSDTADELASQLLDALVQLGMVVEERTLIPDAVEDGIPDDPGDLDDGDEPLSAFV
jgi:hypothetical protein